MVSDASQKRHYLPTLRRSVAKRLPYRWPGARQSGKIAFAPDGRSVVTADTILRRWDIASGKSLYADAAALGHTAPIRRLYFTPDGKRLASVDEGNFLRIWDVASAKPIHTRDFGTSNPDGWDWSSDGSTTYRDDWTLTPDGGVLIGVDKSLRVCPIRLGRHVFNVPICLCFRLSGTLETCRHYLMG